ncbi:MAG: hypothetical protein MJ240_08315 [Kiritimatiellae bacterium]|nr:hypothetical protein [Kiritimatiellia bacterium]
MSMLDSRGVGLVALMVTSVGVVFAGETVRWTDNTNARASWNEAANWTDASGKALEEPPTNGTYDVVFEPLDNAGSQEIRWSPSAAQKTGNANNAAFNLSSIVDPTGWSRRTIVFQTESASLQVKGVNISVDDASGFTGYWRSAQGQTAYTLNATAEKTVKLSNLSIFTRPSVSVPMAGAKGEIESLMERGALEKRGAGELVINATHEADTTIHVSDGTLTLAGDSLGQATNEGPIAGARLHRDAWRAETIKTYVDPADGRTYVTNWSDVTGNGNYAWFDFSWNRGSTTHLSEYSHAPFLNAGIVSGMPVVDFGRMNAASSETLGPVACWIKLSERKNGIRECFYAGGYSETGGSSAMFGDYRDGNYPFHRIGNGFISRDYGCQGLVFGDLLVNNEPTNNLWRVGNQPFHVFAGGSTNAFLLGALGTDRLYSSRVGGCRLGEVLLFTNVLTHAERVRISNYLMRKWKVNSVYAEACTAGAVTLTTDTTAICVPEGRQASIGEVTAVKGTLVKKGGGKLVVGALNAHTAAETPSVDVQGGEVAFAGVNAGPTADAPATDPYLWLDATASTSFVYTNKEDDATAYVKMWKDRRPEQSAVYAKIPESSSDYVDGAWASRVENAVGDKAVVDFGGYGVKTATAAFLDLSTGTGANCYDGFIVWRFKYVNMSSPVFGSSNIQFYRSNSKRLIHSEYGVPVTRSALWTIDGAPLDPMAAGLGDFSTDEFHVVSVSASAKVAIDLLGNKDRLKQGTAFGGVQVAEQILYNRRLTPAERRQTIQYLMKRWKGKNAPFAGPAEVAQMTFSSGSPVVVNSDTEMSVASFAGGNGTLVKKGTGVVTMSGLSGKPVTALAVQEGTLSLSLGCPVVPAAQFDAMDTDAITAFVTEDGARTNVTSVLEANRNGLTATAYVNPDLTYVDSKDGLTKSCAIAYTNPVWRAAVMPDGVARPTFDFGRKSGYYSTKYPSSAAMKLSSRFVDKICEAHAVISASAEGDYGTVFGDTSKYQFMSGGTSLFSKSYSSPVVTNGYIAVNGEAASPYSRHPAGFHLLSVAPTEGATVGTIMLERNIEAGGGCVSEYLLFTNVLTSAQRAFLQGWLQHKWFGAEAPIWPEAFASIEVAAGATLNVADGMRLQVGKITGSGTIAGTSLVGVNEVEIPWAGDTTIPVTVSGSVGFATSGTLRLVGAPTQFTLPCELSLVVAGTALEAAAFADWTIAATFPTRCGTRIVVSGNTLKLALTPPGLVVNFR